MPDQDAGFAQALEESIAPEPGMADEEEVSFGGRSLETEGGEGGRRPLPGCGHAPFLTRPELFNRVLETFLE